MENITRLLREQNCRWGTDSLSLGKTGNKPGSRRGHCFPFRVPDSVVDNLHTNSTRWVLLIPDHTDEESEALRGEVLPITWQGGVVSVWGRWRQSQDLNRKTAGGKTSFFCLYSMMPHAEITWKGMVL